MVAEIGLPKNPVYGIAIKKQPKDIVRYLLDEERKAHRNSERKRLYVLILLAVTTARRGELMRLRWCGIDIKRRIAIVSQTNMMDGNFLIWRICNHLAHENTRNWKWFDVSVDNKIKCWVYVI